MGAKKSVKQKCCGNCHTHVVYEFPDKIFCCTLFAKNRNPIMSTLSCCEEWSPSNQECYCVEEATKKQARK